MGMIMLGKMTEMFMPAECDAENAVDAKKLKLQLGSARSSVHYSVNLCSRVCSSASSAKNYQEERIIWIW